MREPLIQVENLTKTYTMGSQEVNALRGVSLTIDRGEFVAIMGPSGSGKTTLLNLIAGIDRPDRGQVLVAGTDLGSLDESKLAKWRARHIGFVFQFYNLLPVLTAAGNVELPLLLTKLSGKERREHVRTALDLVGLGDRMHHYPRQLSGGQEQRVAIARALVTDPTVIVADEPTGDLDKQSATEILDLLTRLNEEFGKTIVMVTHDPRAAEKAHAVRHLDKGELD
jgi:putative ABC transport system ATP-binding protein